jgi:hypothetical protein
MMLAIALCDIYRTTFDRAASRVMIWLRQRAIVLDKRKSRRLRSLAGATYMLPAAVDSFLLGSQVFDLPGTAGWTRTTDLLIHSQAL